MAYVAGTLRPGINTDNYGNNYVTNYYGNASDDGLGDAYIPEIFSRKMLKDFYAMTVFSDIANTDLTSRSLGK